MACMCKFVIHCTIYGFIIVLPRHAERYVRSKQLDQKRIRPEESRDERMTDHSPLVNHRGTARLKLRQEPYPQILRRFAYVHILFVATPYVVVDRIVHDTPSEQFFIRIPGDGHAYTVRFSLAKSGHGCGNKYQIEAQGKVSLVLEHYAVANL